MDDLLYYESKIPEELYDDFDVGDDVLTEEVVHNEVIRDLKPFFYLNGPPLQMIQIVTNILQ